MLRARHSGFIPFLAPGTNVAIRGLTGLGDTTVRLSLSYEPAMPAAAGVGVTAQRIAQRRLKTDRLPTEVPAEKVTVVTSAVQNAAKTAGTEAYGDATIRAAEDFVIANETTVAITDIRWEVVIDVAQTMEVTEPPNHCRSGS